MFNRSWLLKNRSHKILNAFLISYIIVLIIPIVIGSIVYVMTLQIVEKEASELRMNMLIQACNTVDSKLDEVKRMAIGISLGPNVQEFLSTTRPLTTNDRYMVTRVLRELHTYRNNNSFMDDFYIYYKKSDVIINYDGMYTPSFFYDNFISYKNTLFNQWYQKILNQRYYDCISPSSDMIYDSWPKRMITYFQSIPIGESKNPSALFVALIDEKKLSNLLKDAAVEGTAYIVDKNNNIIIKVGTDPISSLPNYNQLNSESNIFHTKINNKSIVVSFTTSPNTGWKYVSVIPRSVFFAKVNYIRNIMIWLTVFCFGIGAIMAFLMAKKQYTPIRRIVDTISTWIGDTRENSLNELDYIMEAVLTTFKKNRQLEQTYSKIIKENEEIKERNKNNSTIMRDSLIARLLKGKMEDYKSIRQWLSNYNVDFPYLWYDVVLFHIDDQSRFVQNDRRKELRLIRLIVSSIEGKVSDIQYKGYVNELEDDTFDMIINFSGNVKKEDVKSQVLEMAVSMKHFIEECFHITLTIGIGGIQNSIEGVQESYRQAVAAMDYKIIKGSNSVISYDEIVDDDQDYYYPMQVELQLINFIKAGDAVKCKSLLKNIYEENLVRRKLPSKLIKYLFFNIMSTAIKTLDEINTKYEDALGRDFDLVSKIADCDTVSEIYHNINEIYECTCGYISKHNVSHNIKLRQQILQFIDKHYIDESLTQTAISDSFGITAPYLSKFFKQEMGENMLDYINKLRVKKTKFYLEDPNISLQEVAQKVGFGCDRTLIRAFKHYEGVTPGKYRSTLHLDKSSKEIV